MRITAAVVEASGGSFALQELADLICRDQWVPVPLPAVLGHEGAATVKAVGRGVTRFAPGDRVGMSYDSCGHCPTCAKPG
jgi:aryl-alcohol dehydrogenase